MSDPVLVGSLLHIYDIKRAGEILKTYVASDADIALQEYSDLVGITVTNLILMGVDAYERKTTHHVKNKEYSLN